MDVTKSKFQEIVKSAFKESTSNILSVQERKIISLIEKRRSFLLNSKEKINVISYGAGSKNSNRKKEEMRAGITLESTISKITSASKPQLWATFLFKLVQKLKPLSCVELGSCVGISASYQAMALKINGNGTIVTLEGSPEIANLAKKTIDILEIKNASIIQGPFQLALIEVLKTCKPIDFFFNDGHHDHDAVIQYFNQAIPYLSNVAVVVFDDISWSKGMEKAWKEIKTDKRVVASIDIDQMGIILIQK